jgi:hypothetical protein
MLITLMYVVVFAMGVLIFSLVVWRRARADARRRASHVQKVPEELRIRHAVSRMSNGGYKGSQIELKVYNGDI